MIFSQIPGNTQIAVARRDPLWDQVTLLLMFDGSEGSQTILDSSRLKHTVTAAGNAQITLTGDQKFTGGVMLMDGTGDYLTVPEHAGFGFGTGTDYTIEAFVNYASSGVERVLVDTRKASDSVPRSLNIYNSTSNKLAAFDSSTVFGNTGSALGTSAWEHIAIARSGSTTKMFRSGSEEWSTGSSIDMRTTRPLVIGANFAFGSLFTGRMKCFRITKGTARYTGTYTVPTEPFPTA